MKRVMIGILVMLISLQFVVASFSAGNPNISIKDFFGSGEKVEGTLNVSFTNQIGSSVLKDSLGNSISLIDLATYSFEEGEFDFFCTPADCESDYAVSNPNTTKSFLLNNGQKKKIGLKLEGTGIFITSLDFLVESDAQANCFNQIEIDVLSDGIIEKINNKKISSECGSLKTYSCFNTFKGNLIESSIMEEPYCQEMTLSVSPSFQVGAWIKKITSGTQKITLSLRNDYGESINGAGCEINKSLITETGSEVYCDVNLQNPTIQKVYLCIHGDSGDGNFKIRGYSDNNNGCAYYGDEISENSAAYQMFIKGYGFNSPGQIKINNSLEDGSYLSDLVTEYLQDRYDNMDCSEGCIIPITISAKNVNQNMTISNLTLRYGKTSFPDLTDKKIYEVSETPAKISTYGYSLLSLNLANFSVPKTYGNFTFELKIDDSKVASKKVFVERVPEIKAIYIPVLASSVPANITAIINFTNSSVVSYKWEFGDGTNQTTTVKSVMHTYNLIGNYTLKLVITDENLRTNTKSMQIYVGSAKEIVNSTIKELGTKINKINTDVSGLDIFWKEQILKALNLTNISSDLVDMQREYNQANGNETIYGKLVSRLMKIDLPSRIAKTTTANQISFYPSLDNINLDALAEITGENYSLEDSQNYKEAISSWNAENYVTEISLNEFSGVYDSYQQVIVTIIDVSLKEKQAISETPYFIIQEMENLNFKEDYLEKVSGEQVYLELLSSEKSLTFSTIEEIDITNLAMFVSPKMSRLVLSEEPNITPITSKFNWWLFILALLFLFILWFVVYSLVQQWYKYKYEKFLFKDRTNLYNLITYIENSKRNKLNEDETRRQLSRARWSGEQIDYVFKKYFGKNTGMPEIPLTWLFRLFSRKEERKIDERKSIFQNQNLNKPLK